MNKIKMFELPKIKIQHIIKSNFNFIISESDEKQSLIQQQDTPLFRQLALIRGEDTKRINEIVFVEAKHNKKRRPLLEKLLKEGFYYNGKLFVRYGKSSSQAKDGVTVFIDNDVYEEMMERSQLGVKVEKCVISKYESYRNLILSSCQMVDEELPYIVIVDEYSKMIPDQHVRYAVQKDVEYTNPQTHKKVIAKNQKFIEESTTDIEILPFDGFGVHTKEISQLFSKYTTSTHDSVLFQIRLPFMKGVTIETDFKKYYASLDIPITKIKDVFGKWHDIDKIDCIWNTSMWKGAGIFKKEFGSEGWNEYLKRVNKYGYKIGISKYSHHLDEINLYSKLNFQYLQCLDLWNTKYIDQYKNHDKYDILDKNNNGKIVDLATYSTDLLEKIIKGDKLYSLKFLGINNTLESDLESKYIQAILTNDAMLKDPSIKKMLKRKLDKTITQMKYGKIFAKGFYHTVVGDIKGYLEYAAGLNIIGCLHEGEFFTHSFPIGDAVSFRSPLVDPSEVNKIKLTTNDFTDEYLQHLKNHDICMINMYDLTQQQQGGMDMDGDSVFLSVEPILINSKINTPIVVDMDDKVTTEPVEYCMDEIVKYECNSRDSRIGEITNIATSILNHYTENEKWKKVNADNVSLLRLYQGKEIDFLKTGFRWIITKNLRKYLKKLPYFLLHNYPKKLDVYNRLKAINKSNNYIERVEYNAFKSPSPLNELCEYIEQWEKRKIDWDRSLINNGHLLVDNSLQLEDKKVMKKIRKIIIEFDEKFREILDTEEEIDMKPIADLYKNKLHKIIGDEYLLANYCIKTAYRSMSTDKTLCWLLFSDVMLSNLKNNSDERKELKIVETSKQDVNSHEFLGRYYKFKKVLGE